jgi:hypothetical protein
VEGQERGFNGKIPLIARLCAGFIGFADRGLGDHSASQVPAVLLVNFAEKRSKLCRT